MEKPKTLFDHITQITNVQDPKYWDKLDDASKKTWSNYMVFRFLSMKYEWVELIASVQPYLQEVPPKACYLALIDLVPKGRHFMKYIKPASADKYESWLVQLVAKHYECSINESEDYLKILYASRTGKQKIIELSENYGTDPKIIKKLKITV
jgi:hypothetical protein|tara:strand:- start:5151 stop:5606 length:456 start_codon:yes stop_codon:yes gene_type:complete